jgi:hypothetical protein
MIAYLFWHCAYPTTTAEQYEEALMRFQQRLGQQQPPGFGGSASFRVAALPWLGNRPGYEDWCLLDGSWALDPLNAFAVAGPVISAHDAAAAQMEDGHGGLYALVWGEPVLPKRSTAVWLTRPRGMRRIALTMVVLPTPGPPVMTSTLQIRASRMAAIWLSARAKPMCFSTQGKALSGSIRGQGSVPFATRMSRGRWCVPPDTNQRETRRAFRQPGRRLPCFPAARVQGRSRSGAAAPRVASRPRAPAD